MRSRSAQKVYSIMIDFMEKHGDISKAAPGAKGQLDHFHRWLELIELLNKESGKSKTIEQWRKTWSDFKHYIYKKASKAKQYPGDGLKFTDVELRVMKLLKKQFSEKKLAIDNNEVLIKEETNLGDEKESDSFFSDNGPTITNPRMSRQSSLASEASSTQHSISKTNQHSNELLVSDRYLEFEREKEQMAHEREMAWIKLNNETINIFGRMVCVLESLSPSIQKYLHTDNNKSKNT